MPSADPKPTSPRRRSNWAVPFGIALLLAGAIAFRLSKPERVPPSTVHRAPSAFPVDGSECQELFVRLDRCVGDTRLPPSQLEFLADQKASYQKGLADPQKRTDTLRSCKEAADAIGGACGAEP